MPLAVEHLSPHRGKIFILLKNYDEKNIDDPSVVGGGAMSMAMIMTTMVMMTMTMTWR